MCEYLFWQWLHTTTRIPSALKGTMKRTNGNLDRTPNLDFQLQAGRYPLVLVAFQKGLMGGLAKAVKLPASKLTPSAPGSMNI